MRADAEAIARSALQAADPRLLVQRALQSESIEDGGRLLVVAAGKAAATMAFGAADVLGGRIERGIVISQDCYIPRYAKHMPPHFAYRAASHPLPDERSFAATREALSLVDGLAARDAVIFLLSGGASAMFEDPLASPSTLRMLNAQLIESGAGIAEINAVRKRLSAVKGGRFAQHCAPAHVLCLALSDVVGNDPGTIGSGPVTLDESTEDEALDIVGRYGIDLYTPTLELLSREMPKRIDNVAYRIIGDASLLSKGARAEAAARGYDVITVAQPITCEARTAGRKMAQFVREAEREGCKRAIIATGETVVRVLGNGMGGRNQETALAAAAGIDGRVGAAVFSIGSDGRDGPTDAAGGYVDWTAERQLRSAGMSIDALLEDNDAYHALQASGGLVRLGATGTNVDDLIVGLFDPRVAEP